MTEVSQQIEQLIAQVLPEAKAFRHDLHQFPELTWQEVETSRKVAEALEAIEGISVTRGVGKYGVIGLIEGEKPGPTVALRADMDALPVQEANEHLSYRSKRPGTMHACGHDGHTANLLGVAKILAALRSEIHGKVQLIFQPAEEGGAGALAMVKDGALKGVDAIFGLHGWPELPCGTVGVRPGPFMAGNAVIKIKVTGKGGHAAMPQLTTDQVLVSAKVIEAVHHFGGRYLHPAEPFVVTISHIHGGEAHNVIPHEVAMGGTIRFFSQDVFERARKKIEQIVTGVASSFGASANLEFEMGYPAVVNHGKTTDFFNQVVEETLGKDKLAVMALPTMGSEDFAYFLHEVPGTYFFLGMDDGTFEHGYPCLHNPSYNFNDDALSTGMRLLVSIGLKYGITGL